MSKPHLTAKPRTATPEKAPLQNAYPIEVSTWDAKGPSPLDATYVTAHVLPWSMGESGCETNASPAPSAVALAPREETRGPKPPADGEPAAPTARQEPPRAEVTATRSEVPVSGGETLARQAAHSAPAGSDHQVEQDNQAGGGESSFVPVWEVDRFTWPADVEQLYGSEAAYFAHAGQKLREAAREGLRVLAITAARSREGCTTLAICLARAAAEAGARVAMLDANVQSPGLATRMGVKFPHAWTEAVDQSVELSETAIAAVESPITVLPLTLSSENASRLADLGAADLLRTVSASVDLLIVDLGTGLQHCGAILSCINAAIVVRDMRHTAEQETLALASQLRDSGVSAVGIAENYAPASKGAGKAAA